jgi:hypothetical protein
LVWVYAPGIAAGPPGSPLDARHSAELTGLRLEMLADKAPLQVQITEHGADVLTALYPGTSYGTRNKIGPVLVGADPEAEVLGELYGFGRPGLIRKRVRGAWAYYSAAPLLPAVLLREIAAQSGVHVYNDRDDVTYVNRSFIGLHTPRAGPRVLRFPEPVDLYDVYEERTVATGATEVSVDLPARHSVLYFIGTREEWEET